MEDELLSQIDIDGALAELPPETRDMVLLVYRYEAPADYKGPWPPSMDDIGHYIGMKYHGKPMSEAGIRYRRAKQEALWAANAEKSA